MGVPLRTRCSIHYHPVLREELPKAQPDCPGQLLPGLPGLHLCEQCQGSLSGGYILTIRTSLNPYRTATAVSHNTT